VSGLVSKMCTSGNKDMQDEANVKRRVGLLIVPSGWNDYTYLVPTYIIDV